MRNKFSDRRDGHEDRNTSPINIFRQTEEHNRPTSNDDQIIIQLQELGSLFHYFFKKEREKTNIIMRGNNYTVVISSIGGFV